MAYGMQSRRPTKYGRGGYQRSSSSSKYAGKKSSSTQMAFPSGYKRPSGLTGLYNARASGVEVKFSDIAIGPVTTLNTAASMVCLNGIATGTDYNQRIGREIVLRSNLTRINVVVGANNTNTIVRCILFMDMQANGAVATVTQLLQATNVYSPLNLNNRDRFKVIWDKQYALNSTTNYNIFEKWYAKIKKSCTYTGTSDQISSISTGALYMLVYCNDDTTVVNYYNRLRFTDQ